MSLPTVDSLLDQAMRRANSPLFLTAINNRSLVCEILLQTRDNSGECIIRKSIDHVHPMTRKTALQAACELGYYNIVNVLINEGAELII